MRSQSIPESCEFKINEVYRQFPIGIFKDKVSNTDRLFPGTKACIDLVADGKQDASFWIFELKKSTNKHVGIISELLFYTAVVRDIISGRIITSKSNDKDCYDHTKLSEKKLINSCFLSGDFHPLLINEIIDEINDGFKRLKSMDNGCTVVFHKAKFDRDENGPLYIKERYHSEAGSR